MYKPLTFEEYMKVKKAGFTPEQISKHEDIRKANESKSLSIEPTKDLRTFDFHEMEGKPQTPEANDKIHNQMVEHPDKPMTKGGETFNAASQRALSKIGEIMKESGNQVAVTHNSMWGLLKLWEEKGQPAKLTKDFVKQYTEQDTPEKNAKATGAHFTVNGPKGDIYVVRHGETTDNAKKVFRTKDAELTDKGKQEAKDAGEYLKDKDIKRIHTSDLHRAVETSKIIKDEIQKSTK